jgi:foldase protein PrsA
MMMSDKKKKIFWIVIIAIAVLAILYFLKSLFIVAIVNNQPISRFAFDRELERQGGQQILNKIITEMLIQQEAKRQKVTVTQVDIDQKFKEIDNQLKAQGQSLEAALAAQGQTKADFAVQMKTEILLEKMLSKNITVEDKEITDYFEENKALFEKGTTLESQKEEIKNVLVQQKLSEKLQSWLVDLQSKAKIIYFIKF